MHKALSRLAVYRPKRGLKGLSTVPKVLGVWSLNLSSFWAPEMLLIQWLKGRKSDPPTDVTSVRVFDRQRITSPFQVFLAGFWQHGSEKYCFSEGSKLAQISNWALYVRQVMHSVGIINPAFDKPVETESAKGNFRLSLRSLITKKHRWQQRSSPCWAHCSLILSLLTI